MAEAMITGSQLSVPATSKNALAEGPSFQAQTTQDFDAEQEAELERMAERMIMESGIY